MKIIAFTPAPTSITKLLKTSLEKWQATIGAVLIAAASANATDLVWIGGTGNWNAAGNWSPAQVPTAADNAFITNNGTYTVTVPAGTTATAGTITVGGASGTQALAIDRATLTVSGASVINANGHLDFLVAQSILTGAGNLTVNGTLNWTNGTMSGTGTTTIGGGGVLAIESGGVTLGRTLNNGGTGTWSGGNLTMSAGVVFNNLAGGTFDITADGRLSGSATTPINNSGLFRQTAGTTSTIVTAPLNNSGTLDVLAATLSLNLGGTHTGTMSNALGTTLNFGGGSHVLAAGSFVTGAGVLNLSGGATTLTASGTFDVTGSTLSVTAGTATLASTCNLIGATLNISGANSVVNFNSSGTVAVLNLTGGTLGGTSPVTVTGLLTLGGGTITSALVIANGGLNINGGVTLNGGKLVNPGLAIWSAGNFIGANGAVFSNLLGATFINTFDGNAASGAGATPIFVNAGTFAKTNGTAALGATSIDFQFINTGTVEVQTNTLRYTINQQTAGLTLLDGGGLTAQAQPIQLLGGSLVGTGLVTVANTQNLINSTVVSPGLPLGELDIAGNYQQTASGVLNIELGGNLPGTSFDLVTVTAGGAGGVATLGGTLNVTITNGFSPTKGATFTFLTAVSRVGAFTTFTYPSNEIGLQVSYDLTSAKVTVSNLKPLVANPIVDPAPVIYGAAFNFQFPANTFADPDNDPLSYTALGLPPGITFVGATRTFSGTPTQAGVFPVTVVANDSGTPNLIATNTFTITIDPATLTIAAQPQSKFYGAIDPALAYTVGGLQFSDTPATVLTGTLTRVAGETVAGGPYAITQGTLTANGNYNISFTGSTLAITPAALSITADPKTKTYGAADPVFTVTYAGFVNGETAAVLGGTLAFTRAPGENVGSYLITLSGLTSVNYAISFNTGTLSITKAALSVTADTKTKTYGAADAAFTVAYSGFVNGDTAAVLGGTLAFTRAPGENVGSYLITPGGLTSGNYTITFNTGTLSVTKAALSVTADAKTKTYGAADPVFTVTYAGFVNGETATVLGGTLTFSRAPSENVGSYLITPGGLTSGNYAITFNMGNLTITKAALSVTADAKIKTYGAADPAFTVTYSGFVNSETPTVLGGALAFTRASGEIVGSYLITPSGLTSANYTITFNTSTLSVTKATLSVTAEVKNKTYGAADPALTFTMGGLQFSDTQAGVLTGALTRAPGETVAGGPYAITQGTLTPNGNYAVSFTGNTLTITKAALSVTADAKTKTYGAADPAFTVTYSGFVNGETPAVLGGTLAFSRAPGENVGSYLITPSGLTSGNYTITFNTGTLTITAPTPLMLPLTLVGTTNVVISWSTVSNGTYRVQYKPVLNATNWTDLVGDVTATGSTASKTDILTTSNRFYRVQVLP
jgi:hypothetical protein